MSVTTPPTSDQTPPEKPTSSSNEDDEYADAERNYQPKTLKFWTIVIGMYLSIFLVALVSTYSLLLCSR